MSIKVNISQSDGVPEKNCLPSLSPKKHSLKSLVRHYADPVAQGCHKNWHLSWRNFKFFELELSAIQAYFSIAAGPHVSGKLSGISEPAEALSCPPFL